MYWRNFLTADRSNAFVYKKKYFWKNSCRSLWSTYLGFFWQLLRTKWSIFRGEWFFKHSAGFRNRRHFPSIICRFSNIRQRLTEPWILTKRYQKKRKNVAYKLLKGFFQNIMLYMNGRSAVKNSFSTHGIRTVYFDWICMLTSWAKIPFITLIAVGLRNIQFKLLNFSSHVHWLNFEIMHVKLLQTDTIL